MNAYSRSFSIVALIFVLFVGIASAAAYDHEQDVVYGYKDGMALVMDVFTPTDVEKNGASVVWIVSGGMHSDPRQMRREEVPGRMQALLDGGYVVFAASHGSQPKFSLPEIQHDMPRAVRFIRHNADRFGIHDDRIGVMGFSSGGQLTLQLTTEALGAQSGEDDPVDNESSRVQAAVAYFPGTDMVNFGKEDTTIVEHFSSVGEGGLGPFNFTKWDDEMGAFLRVSDREERLAIFAACSPIAHVTDDDPPVLLIHGDKDRIVPIQQSESFLARMQSAGATCELMVVPGKGHGWGRPLDGELDRLKGWFDTHLLGSESSADTGDVPSLVGKTITTDGEDGIAVWIFEEGGKMSVAEEDGQGGMRGTYEQDGDEIYMTVAGYDFMMIYDGKTLEIEEGFDD
jgi:acetyl esterase/lipase